MGIVQIRNLDESLMNFMSWWPFRLSRTVHRAILAGGGGGGGLHGIFVLYFKFGPVVLFGRPQTKIDLEPLTLRYLPHIAIKHQTLTRASGKAFVELNPP